MNTKEEQPNERDFYDGAGPDQDAIVVDTEGAMTHEEFYDMLVQGAKEDPALYAEIFHGSAEQLKKQLTGIVEESQRSLSEIADKIAAFYLSDTYKMFKKCVTGFDEYVESLPQRGDRFTAGSLEVLGVFVDNIDDLMPYIQKEVAAYKKKTGKVIITFDEFTSPTVDPETGERCSSLFEMVLARAQDAKIAANIPLLESAQIKEHISPVDKISGWLTGKPDRVTGEWQSIMNQGEQTLLVGKDKRGPIDIFATISMAMLGEDDNVKFTRMDFTECDRSNLDGIYTLYEKGITTFTPGMVFRAANGIPNGATISPQQEENTIESIEKSRRVQVTADVTRQMQAYKIDLDEVKINDYLISVVRTTVRVGGTVKVAYQITHEPVLLKYAKTINQVSRIDSNLLNIKRIDKNGVISETIPTTKDRQAVKSYLFRRIDAMKSAKRRGKKGVSNRILLDSLYKVAGIEVQNRIKTQRSREYICQVLEYWKKEGWIQGYELVQTGRKYKAVDVLL